MSIAIRIQLNENLYLRDPQDTRLGRNIIRHSILLIDEVGFESFTFRKLAERIGSTEASVYRYYENKHFLLAYIVAWYWDWLSYQIDLQTMNLSDPSKKLLAAIRILVEAPATNISIDYVDEPALHRILIAEGSKAHHTKDVDKENSKGFFLHHKNLVAKISDIILEVNPSFLYPHTLASTLLEMANNHIYYAQHLPKLTDISVEGGNWKDLLEMLEFFAFRIIRD